MHRQCSTERAGCGLRVGRQARFPSACPPSKSTPLRRRPPKRQGLEPGEPPDDGNAVAGDGCSTACTPDFLDISNQRCNRDTSAHCTSAPGGVVGCGGPLDVRVLVRHPPVASPPAASRSAHDQSVRRPPHRHGGAAVRRQRRYRRIASRESTTASASRIRARACVADLVRQRRRE